jgi:Na+-driven multidrug efflux pump
VTSGPNPETEHIWWVISGTAAIKGIILIFWFRRGRWKTRSV